MALPFARLVALLTPRRAWFQFRLRTLFVLTAVVAVPCAWLTWKIEQKRREREAVAAIRDHGGNCYYRWQSLDIPPGPKWLRGILGDDVFNDVDVVSLKNPFDPLLSVDAALAHLDALPRVRLLWLPETNATDAALHHLKKVTCLERLSLNGTQITDDGLSNLHGLTSLKALHLSDTQITDAGLKHLSGLTGLKMLVLEGTQVTDVGLKHLYGLTGLKMLVLTATQTTDAGDSDFQKVLPNCKIRRWPGDGRRWPNTWTSLTGSNNGKGNVASP